MKLITFFVVIIPSILGSLTFSEVIDLDIPGVSQASADWGDYNNNGFLDLLITGHTGQERISRVYNNNGDNTFSYQENIVLTGVNRGRAVWGDLNNNGYLDIVLSGVTDDGEIITKVYHNSGAGSFTESALVNLPGVRDCTIDLVDFNNNGWLDVFIAGDTGVENIARLYENNGDVNFIWREDLIFPGFRLVDSVWGDLNGNGFQDLIISGESNQLKTTNLYFNLAGNAFSLQDDTGFPCLFRGSVALGDYDGNGWLDLLITGIADTGRVSQVFQNTGNGVFSLVASLAQVGYGEGIWADLNNNGLLDILVTGAETGTYNNIASIYLNSGNNSFALLDDVELVAVSTSSIAALDINNNGKTDLFLTGLSHGGVRETVIYLNGIDTVNALPLPPSSLNSVVGDGHVTLHWNDGSDQETATAGLSYNIWLRPMLQTELQLMSPMADMNSGFRRVARRGNAGQGNQFQLIDIPPGDYEWAVQTIDSANAGSTFSDWEEFYLPPQFLPAPENVSIWEEDEQFFLSWDPVPEANIYRIFGSDDPYSEDWIYLDATTGTFWDVTIYHQRYFFRVVAAMD